MAETASSNLSGALTGYLRTRPAHIPVSLITVPLGSAYFFNAGKAVAKGDACHDNWFV